MRCLLVFAFLCCSAIGLSQDKESNLNWLTNLEEAQAISKKENKPILIYFTGSDWCAPCKMLQEDFFETSQFQEKAENMVLVYIDRPRRVDILTPDQLAYNKTIIAKYNRENTYPKMLALNHKGKVLGKISGYSSLRDTSNHFSFVDKYLQ